LLLQLEAQLADVRGRRWLNEEVWMSCVEATHATVGAALARAWTLPAAVAEAVETAADPDAPPEWTLGWLVRLAGALAAREGMSLRRDELARAAAVVEQARQARLADDALMARAVQGVKERVSKE
jgi:HD-like signal output (HDOD) protein